MTNKNSTKELDELQDLVKISEPLVEKYRPKKLEDLVGQEHIDEMLKDIIEKGKKGDLDNFIFIGPPGVGKTSAARILASEINRSSWKSNFVEINVPDDNKDLNFINGDLKEFIRHKPRDGALFKIVFFDECEELSRSAQSALRKIVEEKEKYKYVRYIFATNYSEKLISQLQGERITVLHFRKIPNRLIKNKLDVIIKSEHIDIEGGIEGEALKIIVENADGSLRKGVKALGDLRDTKNIITLKKVKNHFSYIEPSNVEDLLTNAINQKEYEKDLHEIIISKGITIEKLFQNMIKVIDDKDNKIDFKDAKEKRYVIDQIGLYSWRIDQSSDKTLQLKCFLNALASMRDN